MQKNTRNICLVMILFFTGNTLLAQSIHIHSVGTLRSTGFLQAGYTIDGDHMAGSRAKLINPSNFSDTGTYKKSVVLHSGYTTTGSLEQVTGTEGIDIFFFGSFSGSDTDFSAFSQAEIDSLYTWSLRGGRLIIAEQVGLSNYPMNHLSEKWGYDLKWKQTSEMIPLQETKDNMIFDGPFGNVEQASQGGSAQGYIVPSGEHISVLARNTGGQITLMVDCKTRDLICPDTDAYTDLGGISNSDLIENQQDRFWANTIVFMDSMVRPLPPAQIWNNGDTLFTDANYSPYWLLNYNEIEPSDTSVIVANTPGYYWVVYKDRIGCRDTSDVFVLGQPQAPAIHCPADITTYTDPGTGYASVMLPEPMSFDSDGIASIVNNGPDTFAAGTTEVIWTVTDSAGYSSSCSHNITVLDNEDPVIECPPGIITENDPGQNFAKVDLGMPIAHDNVGIFSIRNTGPEQYKVGTTDIRWIAEDSAGNDARCRQSITVRDVEFPVITCPADTSATAEPGKNTAALILNQPAAADNDGIDSVSNDAAPAFPVGSSIVTWTATDLSGNSVSCKQTVTILPGEPASEALKIPNIITPNGDGINDLFFIRDLPEHSHLVIFDRTEKIIYESDNYNNQWNGPSGHSLSNINGTFWYLLTLPEGEIFSGFLAVKR